MDVLDDGYVVVAKHRPELGPMVIVKVEYTGVCHWYKCITSAGEHYLFVDKEVRRVSVPDPAMKYQIEMMIPFVEQSIKRLEQIEHNTPRPFAYIVKNAIREMRAALVKINGLVELFDGRVSDVGKERA